MLVHKCLTALVHAFHTTSSHDFFTWYYLCINASMTSCTGDTSGAQGMCARLSQRWVQERGLKRVVRFRPCIFVHFAFFIRLVLLMLPCVFLFLPCTHRCRIRQNVPVNSPARPCNHTWWLYQESRRNPALRRHLLHDRAPSESRFDDPMPRA